MDVHDDAVPGSIQPEHSFRKNVPCRCLDDVLHELGSVAFQPQPLFLFADTFIGHGLIAEAVQTHFRLHIHQPSAGRQHHEHHAALIIEANAVCFCGSSLSDAGGSCFVHIPPELCNMGVGQTPGIHQRFQFFFLQTVVQCAHCFQRTHGATVAKSQLGNFAFLPQMSVHAVLFYGDMEHLRSGSAVNVAALCKNLLPPMFPSDPCDDPRLDGGEVCHIKTAAGFRHKSGADKLGQYQRHGVIEHFHGIRIAAANQCPCDIQIRQMVLR